MLNATKLSSEASSWTLKTWWQSSSIVFGSAKTLHFICSDFKDKGQAVDNTGESRDETTSQEFDHPVGLFRVIDNISSTTIGELDRY